MMRSLRRRPFKSSWQRNLLLSYAAVVLNFSSQVAAAAPWDFQTIVDLDIIHTDNLRLALSGQEESEIIYRVAPFFVLNKEGDTLSADIRYRPEGIFYTDEPDADELFHSLDANATLSLVKDALFVDASALSFQSVLSPTGNIPTSNIPISENRVDSAVYSIRPYWQQNLGAAEILLEVQYVETNLDDQPGSVLNLLQNNEERSGAFRINNHSQGQGLAWGVGYQRIRVDYDTALTWEFQQATADLGFWLNGGLRVFVSGGLETPFNAFLDSSLDDEIWEVGFQYKPNQRLDLEIAAGERSFGDTYRAQMTFQLRRGQTRFSYSEQPVSRGQFGADRRPIFLPDNLDSFLDRPGETDRFVQKRAEWNTAIELAKSELSFRVFWDSRDARTTDVGVPLQDEMFAGASLRWDWNLGTRSSVAFDLDAISVESGVSEDDLVTIGADYSYRVSQRFSVVVRAQRSEQKTDTETTGRYREHQLHLILRTELF